MLLTSRGSYLNLSDVPATVDKGNLFLRRSRDFRAPRIISNLQGRCGHEKAAEEAAEQENLISTIVEII
jgi:hypothetical protein